MEVRKGYKQTEVGVIPEDWDVECIKNLALINTGSKNTQDRIENGMYPFFVRSQTVERIDSYSFDGEAVLTAGDGVGVGKVIHYVNEKFDCHQRVYRITDFTQKLNGYFFFLYFSKNFLNRIMQMTAKSSVDSVRMEMIANMQIPIPPTKSEQTAIANAISDADALITSLEKLIEKKRAIKQGAMQKMLRPKVDWKVMKLGEIILLKNGYAFSSEFFSNSGPIVITPGNFKLDGGLLFNDRNTLRYSGNITKEMQFQNGDLLIVMTDLTPSCNLLGKPGIVNSEEIILHNQRIGKISITNKLVNQNYIYWFLASELFSKRMKETATGSTVRHTSVGSINGTIISFPTFEEQTYIATILSDMDAAITVLEQKLGKYKLIKLGMMQELLTGKIRLNQDLQD